MGDKKINPLFKLLGIKNIYVQFDKKVAMFGWSKGCKWLIKSLGITYKYKNNLFSKGATIIYANHPTGLDPYLLTAILGREDSYFWGDIYQSKKGINVSRHVIPIAPKAFWSILKRPLTNWPGYIYMRLTTPTLTKKETRAINKKSINKTLELLKKDKLVIIFPSGGEYEFLKSGKGLSIILAKCKEQKINIKVKELKIKNFGELRLLSHFLFNTKIEVEIVISLIKAR